MKNLAELERNPGAEIYIADLHQLSGPADDVGAHAPDVG